MQKRLDEDEVKPGCWQRFKAFSTYLSGVFNTLAWNMVTIETAATQYPDELTVEKRLSAYAGMFMWNAGAQWQDYKNSVEAFTDENRENLRRSRMR